MAEVDRLGPLQVGVAGHRPVAVGLGELEQARHRARRRARSPAASAPGRPSPRRWRPGRCASGRCGACRPAARPPRRAGARSPCGCPRRPGRTRTRAPPSAARPARARRSSPPAPPRRGRRSSAAPARGPGTGRGRTEPAAQSNSSERLIRQKRGSGSLRKRDISCRESARASHTRVDLGLADRVEEGQRQRAGRGRFGDRELALAVAELAQVREEVDAGQVGLGGDTALGEAADRRVAVELGVEPDRVDEPAAQLAPRAGDGSLDPVDAGQPLGVERARPPPCARACGRASRPGRRRGPRRRRRGGS